MTRPNPFLREIETCDDLVAYCNKLKVQFGLMEQSSEEMAKNTEKAMISAYSQQDID
jgi:hypothetical protein